jgi:hypothetical protein
VQARAQWTALAFTSGSFGMASAGTAIAEAHGASPPG